MARTGHGSRCRQHGGLSTGPKTPEGRDRIRFALLKHGQYTTEAKQERLEWRELSNSCVSAWSFSTNSRETTGGTSTQERGAPRRYRAVAFVTDKGRIHGRGASNQGAAGAVARCRKSKIGGSFVAMSRECFLLYRWIIPMGRMYQLRIRLRCAPPRSRLPIR
jgi:hypothetical protein